MKKVIETWSTQFVDKANQGDSKCAHVFEYSPGWFDKFSFRKAICTNCFRCEIQIKTITETEVPDPVTPFEEVAKTLKDSPVKTTPYIKVDELNILHATGAVIGTAIATEPVEEPVEEPLEEPITP